MSQNLTIFRLISHSRDAMLVLQLTMIMCLYNLQLANHLDRAVSNLGRNPLKVLVQVNTSGEECE